MKEASCRKIVYERAGGACERCARSDYFLTCHHRRKRSSGGEWSPVNIVAICGHGTSMGRCHSWVESNPNEAESQGWHLRPWVKDPGEVPVLYHGTTWVYLLEDGTVEEVGDDC